MKWLRRTAVVTVWLMIAAAALLLSAAFHGRSPLARRAARDLVNRLVSTEIEGELRIGRVDYLGPDRIVTRHVALYDREGTRVVIADEVVLVPDLSAALDGRLRFASARLRDGMVRLEEGTELPTFVELFEPATPPSPGPGLHAVVDDIRLREVTVYGELLGLEGIRVEHLEAHGRLEYDEELIIQIWSGRGDMVEPYDFVGHIDRIVGRISDDDHEGLRLHVRGHTDTDRVRANIAYAVPEDEPSDAPSELDLLLHAMPIQAETLRELGFDWADYLHGEARGYLRLYGPTEDLRLRAWLETEAGEAGLEGHFPEVGASELRARTRGLDLADLVVDAPQVRVAGSATMHIPPGDEEQTRVSLDLEPFRYEGYEVPPLEVEGTLEEEAFRIDRAEGPYAGGRVRARGKVTYDGKVDVRVRARVPQVAHDPNLSRLFPDARARLEGDVALVTATDAPDRLDFRGRIVLRDVVYGPLTADRLAIEGFARGDPDRPEARLQLDGSGVAVADYPLGEADVRLRGGPRSYVATGRFAAPGERRVELDATIEATRQRYALDAQRIELAVGDLVWRGRAKNVVVHPDRDVVVDQVVLANGTQRLEAKGVWRFRGPEEIEAQLQGFDLAGLRGIFGDVAPAIGGNADVHLGLSGDIDDPELVLEGALRDLSYRGVDDISVVYVFSYQDGELALDGQADLGVRGNVAITSTGLVDPAEPTLEQALVNGVYELDLALADVALPVIRKLAGEERMPEVSGAVGGRLHAEGPIQAPSFEGTLTVPELGLPGWPTLGVRTEVSYENGALNARVATEDERGPLIEAEGSVLLDLAYMVTHPDDALAALEAVPWRLSVRMPARSVLDVPEPIRGELPDALEPLELSLTATLAGGSFQTQGDLIANLAWKDDLSLRPCGRDANPRATISAELDEGATRVELVGHLGAKAVMFAEATAPTPLDEWLRQGEIAGSPPVSLKAELRQMNTGAVPWVCETFDGPVSGSVVVDGLFTDRPTARTRLATNRLVVRRFRDETLEGNWSVAFQTPPLDGTMELRADHRRVEAATDLRWWNGGVADVVASLPVTWNARHPVPDVPEDVPPQLEAELKDVPLGLLLAAVPNLIEVEGTVTGRLATRGPPSDLELVGRLAVRDGFFQVMPMGQQVGNVEGDVVFHGDWIELERLVASEHEGRLRIRGGINMNGLAPTSGQLALRARRFPVRNEGAVLAHVSGTAIADADFDPDKTIARVALRDLSLTLPDEGMRSVQDLEPHRDVRIADVERRDREEGNGHAVVIAIETVQPFWVRRNDFAALVSMDLGVTYLDDLFVDGSVRIRDGYFEVFGKRFEVEQASLQFDGRKDLDPAVSLQAIHHLGTGSADWVGVTVTGQLSTPQVQFSTNVTECGQRGEIITLLVTGRCARSARQGPDAGEAGQQAASFLAGVAAGVLTLSAREQFGDLIPIIVLESGDQAFRSAKVRAGFQFDELIPDPLRPYVKSVYVEGFFTASGSEGGQSTPTTQSREHGVLLELQFPHNIVGTGIFSPPQSWSVDVTWEP